MSNLTNNTIQLEALLAKVNALPETGGGGGESSLAEKEVNFYDYDGSLLYAYTLEEV
jgi:hypothetical protein